MNKQELIEKIKNCPYNNGLIVDTIQISRNTLLNWIKQLDEPQKVVVPQSVADWYEENKDDFEGNLFRCIYELFKKRNDSELNEFENWVIDANTKPFQTLVNMNQFGYEVEKEKRYLVNLKNGQPLTKTKSGKAIYFNQDIITGNYKFTRKELEDLGFGWVFNCEGVEVEEVEE